jgi:hypothetical protein
VHFESPLHDASSVMSLHVRIPASVLKTHVGVKANLDGPVKISASAYPEQLILLKLMKT